MLEIDNADSRLHVARKDRRHDEWDPPVARYDPYGQGEAVVLVPATWAAALPALARTVALAWACAREQRGPAAEAPVSSRLVP